MVTQYQFTVTTPGRGFVNITEHVAELVTKAKVNGAGLCNVFIHHTITGILFEL